ncbi:homoserine O-acetyltransferase MetX [Demequina sp.]|uniref:homoserine O-acetyltransferase MetX n=1 Tax=Demequina sp. TaxID=2050685 RepID=UPI003D14399B
MTAVAPASAQAAPTLEAIPASGAWRPGDPVGNRRFAPIGDLRLEDGSVVPDAVLAYETWGTLSAARDNAVYIAHALTGDSHAYGDAELGHPTPGWWNPLIGPGKPVDPERHFIVSANVIGGCQGSTGPASLAPDGTPWGSRFPWPSVRDLVTAEVALADLLGIDRWRLIAGPSLGGMRVLEWAATYPERVGALAVLGTTSATTADQLAWGVPQVAAIRADPGFRRGDYYDAPAGSGPHVGLGIARQIAHVTYRSAEELGRRFDRDRRPDGVYEVQSYLEHHGEKLARRFDANTYLRLVHAINGHDIGRGRGGVDRALARYEGAALVIAVDSDRLYPVGDAERVAAALPQAGGVHVVSSSVGHDGFLVESAAINEVVGEFERAL